MLNQRDQKYSILFIQETDGGHLEKSCWWWEKNTRLFIHLKVLIDGSNVYEKKRKVTQG